MCRFVCKVTLADLLVLISKLSKVLMHTNLLSLFLYLEVPFLFSFDTTMLMIHCAFAVLTPLVLGSIFIIIMFIIRRFYIALKTHVGIKIVQTWAINLLTSIDPS